MGESARDQARALPENPGCYLMKNAEGTVIYVGKAKNLKRRVNSYFLPNRNAKTAALVEKIVNIDYVITGNEYEALVLENNLIKKYNPHYNIFVLLVKYKAVANICYLLSYIPSFQIVPFCLYFFLRQKHTP